MIITDPAQVVTEAYKANFLGESGERTAHAFFVDLGTMFAIEPEHLDAMTEAANDVLDECQRICRAAWSWSWEERLFYVLDEDGTSVLPDGRRIAVTDAHRYLWISFDSLDDAMLTRLSVVGLRNERDAVGRGMPQSAE